MSSVWNAMNTYSTATAVICTTMRRPPGIRSIVGPINGATTTNGAKLTIR